LDVRRSGDGHGFLPDLAEERATVLVDGGRALCERCD